MLSSPPFSLMAWSRQTHKYLNWNGNTDIHIYANQKNQRTKDLSPVHTQRLSLQWNFIFHTKMKTRSGYEATRTSDTGDWIQRSHDHNQGVCLSILEHCWTLAHRFVELVESDSKRRLRMVDPPLRRSPPALLRSQALFGFGCRKHRFYCWVEHFKGGLYLEVCEVRPWGVGGGDVGF